MNNSIGSIIKNWRKQQRYSQLQLALEIDVSSKHISFIETGKSLPSKNLIIKIGSFLFCPKREINRALYSAGYAPVYAESAITNENLKPIFDAIDLMIKNHMPYPAIVLNRDWDIVNANDAAKELLFKLGFSSYKNIVEAIISDYPNTLKILNWQESALVVLIRIRQEISLLGGSPRLLEFEGKLSDCFAQNEESMIANPNTAILSTHLQLPDIVLSFFSIIAQLGTVQDITVSEFKIELLFPSDEKTKQFYALKQVKNNINNN